MRKMFGYKGCDERRNYEVRVKRKHADDSIIVSEQLTEEESKKVYEKLKVLFLNTSDYMEFEDVDKTINFIPKDEIGYIRIY